jgi:hypothetical protein
MPSLHEMWLKSQSQAERDRAKYAQNFFKHGSRDAKKTIAFKPFYTEQLLLDAALCYEHLAGKMRPLMELYMLRFAISHPDFMSIDVRELLQAKGLVFDKVAPLERREFKRLILPLIVRGMDI